MILHKNLYKFAALFLAALMLLAVAPVQPAAGTNEGYSNYVVRVGLSYGSSSVGYANFQIASGTGRGYDFGYYASDRSFTKLYALSDETKITVIRSNNFNISTNSYVADGSDPTNVVGAYHIELEVSFETQAELDTAVARAYAATNYVCFPAFTKSGYRVRIGRYTSSESAAADLEILTSRLTSVWPDAVCKVVGRGANAYTVIRTGSRTVLYEFDGASKQLGFMPSGGSEPETWYKNYRYYGGFDFKYNSSTSMEVINVMDLVEYVKGVTPYELNTNWPEESLKAHAICAATFAVCNKDRHASYDFDVCTGQHCQVYQGTNLLTAKIKSCVDAVAGMIITYKGTPINAVYHSSNGGSTENSENVWVATLPYLRAVTDPFESLSYANNGLWTSTVSGTTLRNKLVAAGYNIGTVTDVYISKFTEAGNVYSITLTDGATSVTLAKEYMRTVLGMSTLLSQNFIVYSPGKVYFNSGTESVSSGIAGLTVIGGDGTLSVTNGAPSVLTAEGTEAFSQPSATEFIFDGKGWGHSLGLSQIGSRGMAQQGYTFDEILKYYFTDITIEGFDGE